MSSIPIETKTALMLAISGLVSRLQASTPGGDGLTVSQVNTLISNYVSAAIASDAAASAGVSTTGLASIRGAYLSAEKMLADKLVGNPAGLQTLSQLGQAISDSQIDITNLENALAGLGNAFNYVGTVSGGAAAGTAFNLNTLAAANREAGDYYKVIAAGYFKVGTGAAFYANVNDGLVWNTSSNVDIIDNTNSVVSGTSDEIDVTGTTDSGFVVSISAAIKAQLNTLLPLSNKVDGIASRLGLPAGAVTLHTAAEVTSIVRAIINGLTPGLHVHQIDADVLGIDNSVEVFNGTCHTTVSICPTDPGCRVVTQTYMWKGKMGVRTVDGSVIDSMDPTLAQWSKWHVAKEEMEEIYFLLTDIFNNAAQP